MLETVDRHSVKEEHGNTYVRAALASTNEGRHTIGRAKSRRASDKSHAFVLEWRDFRTHNRGGGISILQFRSATRALFRPVRSWSDKRRDYLIPMCSFHPFERTHGGNSGNFHRGGEEEYERARVLYRATCAS